MNSSSIVQKFEGALLRYYNAQKKILAVCVFGNPPFIKQDDGRLVSNLLLQGVCRHDSIVYAIIAFADGKQSGKVPCIAPADVDNHPDILPMLPVPFETSIPVLHRCVDESFQPTQFELRIIMEPELKRVIASLINLEVRGSVQVIRKEDNT